MTNLLFSSSTLLLVLVLVVSVNAQSSSRTSCPLCIGGDEPNLTKFIGGGSDGVSCGDLVSDVALDTEGCYDLQLLGYRYCDCPSYPTEYFCPMCQDAFADIPNRFQVIPGTDDTCDSRLFVKKGDGGSCEQAAKPGFVCGCPGAEQPECRICGEYDGGDAAMTNGDAQLAVDGIGAYTCQEMADQAVLGTLTMEQCALVQNEAMTKCGCVTATTTTDDGGSSSPSSSSTAAADDAAETNNSDNGGENNEETSTAGESNAVPAESDSSTPQNTIVDTNDNSAARSSSWVLPAAAAVGCLSMLSQLILWP